MNTAVSINYQIKEFVKNTVAQTDFKITDETLLFEEGLFDSMGFMALISFIQENFGIQADDNELVIENFESISAIEAYINKKFSVN